MFRLTVRKILMLLNAGADFHDYILEASSYEVFENQNLKNVSL